MCKQSHYDDGNKKEKHKVPYTFSGKRQGQKEINAPGKKVRFDFDTPVTFTSHDYSRMQLEKAKHTDELERGGDTFVTIDAIHSGLGSNSCGQEQYEKDKAKFEDFELSFVMTFE